MNKVIIASLIFLMTMISNSFSSNLTYLCEYNVGYSVEPNNVVEFPVSIPRKSFLTRIYKDYAVIKLPNSTDKITLKLYRKGKTTSENILANYYRGNYFYSDDISTDFSIYINPNLLLIKARLVNLTGTNEINFGFYKCAQIDF